MRFKNNNINFPISPDSTFKQIWNVTLVIMLILTAIITPVRVCFIEDEDAQNWFELDLFFNIYFGIDIFVNLISAYNDETNRTIYSYKKVL